MISITVDIGPRIEKVNKLFNPSMRQDMMEDIVQNLYGEHIVEQFNTQGALFGKKWKQLSESRIEQRKKAGTWPAETPILVEYGYLRGRWDLRWTSEAGYLRTLATYASTHEFGEGRVPQRKILPPPLVGKAIVVGLANRYIDLVVKGI